MSELLDLSLLSVFSVGLLGGVHCAAMCGPIVAALQMKPTNGARRIIPIATPTIGTPNSLPQEQEPSSRPSKWRSLPDLAGYNFGRLSTYVLLGWLAGSAGSGVWLLQHWFPVQQFALVLTSFLLILMGLYLLNVRFVARLGDSLGQGIWRLIQPFAGKRLVGHGFANAVAAGGLWGLVPCAMVYGAAAVALVSGSGASGAAIMLAFGLGTLPNLLLIGVASERLRAITQRPWLRTCAGVTIVGFGALGFMRLAMVNAVFAKILL